MKKLLLLLFAMCSCAECSQPWAPALTCMENLEGFEVRGYTCAQTEKGEWIWLRK